MLHFGCTGASIFINEMHYKNVGADANEGVEVAGPAHTNLNGYTIKLYNGAPTQRTVYGTITLDGTIPCQQNGFGTIVKYHTPLQGGPDGLALVDASGTVLQFISYGGSFIAADGPASGMTSIDIGVEESTDSPVDHSLQLTGTGTVYGDFTWNVSTMPSTFGKVNTGQWFASMCLFAFTCSFVVSGLFVALLAFE